MWHWLGLLAFWTFACWGLRIVFQNLDPSDHSPGLYMETVFTPGQSVGAQPYMLLLIGQKLGAGSAGAGQVYTPMRENDVISLFGAGSICWRMWKEARRIWQGLPIGVLPMADPTVGAAAGNIIFSGPATHAGNAVVTIGNVTVTFAHAADATAADVAAGVAALLTSGVQPGLQATVAVDADNTAKLNVTQIPGRGNIVQLAAAFSGGSTGVTAAVTQTTGGGFARGGILFAGAATGNGSVTIDIGDNVEVVATYQTGDTAADLCAAVAALLTAAAQPGLQAEVAQDLATPAQLDVYHKHIGVLGNELQLRATFGENAGLSATVAQPAGGLGTLDLTTVESVVGDAGYNYLACAVNDATNGVTLARWLADFWSGAVGKPTVGGLCSLDTYANVLALANAIQAKHLMVIGSPGSVSPSYARTAVIMAERARRDCNVSPNDALQNFVTGLTGAWDQTQQFSVKAGEWRACFDRGVSPCIVNASGDDVLGCDVWSEFKDPETGLTIGLQFFTFSGVMSYRLYRVLARWARSRAGDANWPMRVGTQPKTVTVTLPDNSKVNILQSDQSLALALQARAEDLDLEQNHYLNFVSSRTFAQNYQHQVLDYAKGQVAVSAQVWPAPPIVGIFGQQVSNASPPEDN